MSVMTVSELNNYIAFKIKSDIKLRSILVEGEISNFTLHYRTGHLYFTIKDSNSSLKAVMFASSSSHLKFRPSDGMKVVVSGNVDVYTRDGVYQIIVSDMYPSGTGRLYLEYEQLKNKLFEKGLFNKEHKKPIPEYPEKIVAVTSSSGAVLHDIINVLSRRYALAELIVYPAVVQGENAVDSLCDALTKADKCGADVIIIGRGGGSLEDLMAFNSENLAYVIYNCQTPVISAVGHETDTTICDLVADLRAPTPSAAAEVVSPDIKVIKDSLFQAESKLFSKITEIIASYDNKLSDISNRLSALSPEKRIADADKELNQINNHLLKAYENIVHIKGKKLSEKISLLESYSPLSVLQRGYSITYGQGRVIKSSDELNSGDRITVKFSNSEVNAIVEK